MSQDEIPSNTPHHERAGTTHVDYIPEDIEDIIEDAEVIASSPLEGEIIEGEVIRPPATEAMKEKMRLMRAERATPLATTRMDRRVNVTRIINEMGYSPVATLVHIATGNTKALGISKEISAHERNSAAQTILQYTAPTIRPVDFVDPNEVLKQIPVFTGRRELPTDYAPAISYDDETGKYSDEQVSENGETTYGNVVQDKECH